MTKQGEIEFNAPLSLLCSEDPAFFIDSYCKVHDPLSGGWLPFRLWQCQRDVLSVLMSPKPEERQVVILKARQLGQTWLCLGWLLHLALFKPHSTALLFSRRDDEAMDLLSRMTNMHNRLPTELMDGNKRAKSSAHKWEMANGSKVIAFPTGTGDSYTASAVLLDEADLMPDLNKQLQSVKPTTDAGGKLVLLSRSDKSKPESPFKNVYREAARSQGESGWHPIFLPWHARPGRDAAWYERIKRESVARVGSIDEVYEQYPATAEEALAANVLDKRLPPQWLAKAFDERWPLAIESLKPNGLVPAPTEPGVKVFVPPEVGARYVIGADPAQGNPTSDDSALCVYNADTGEQVAAAANKWEPATFGAVIDKLGQWYGADLMIERNNHGHAVLLWLSDNSKLYLMLGHDGQKGWNTTSRGKDLVYDAIAERLRVTFQDEPEGRITIHDRKTYDQLCSIEGASRSAPEGMHDDAAIAAAIGAAAIAYMPRGVLGCQ